MRLTVWRSKRKILVDRFAFWTASRAVRVELLNTSRFFCFCLFFMDLLDKSCYLPLKVRKARSYIFFPGEGGGEEESSRVGKHKCLLMGSFEGWILNVGTGRRDLQSCFHFITELPPKAWWKRIWKSLVSLRDWILF